MNRYPIWKYVVMVITLIFGLLYTMPNFFGDAPAIQVSPGKVTVKIDDSMLGRVEEALTGAGIVPDKLAYDGKAVRARFADTDTQLKAQNYSPERSKFRRDNKSLVLWFKKLRGSFPNIAARLEKLFYKYGEWRGKIPAWNEALDRTYDR